MEDFSMAIKPVPEENIEIAKGMPKQGEKTIRLGICVPARGTIQVAFLINYLRIHVALMKLQSPFVIPVPIFSDMCPLDAARNEIVRSALLSRCDYYLWIDSDTFFSEDVVIKMIRFLEDNPDKHIITGIYYERESPYCPILRIEDEMGIMRPYINYPTDDLFTVDGAGFGCIMMKRAPMDDLVREHKGKVFQFTKEHSEDLFWCSEVRKKGYKIYCHPDLQCAHFGSFTGRWHFLHNKIDDLDEVKELAAYLGITKGEALSQAAEGALMVFREWNREKPETPEQITDFYRKTKAYLYDLTYWWAKNKKCQESVFSEIPSEAISFLDYGCGIGDWGMQVLETHQKAHVDFVDINKPNLDYLKWRLTLREAQNLIIPRSYRVKEEMPIDRKYDVIVCMDVLEHVPDPDVHIKRLHEALRPNGILFASVAKKTKFQPFHISECDPSSFGFVKISQNAYIKDDSELAKQMGVVVNA